MNYSYYSYLINTCVYVRMYLYRNRVTVNLCNYQKGLRQTTRNLKWADDSPPLLAFSLVEKIRVAEFRRMYKYGLRVGQHLQEIGIKLSFHKFDNCSISYFLTFLD